MANKSKTYFLPYMQDYIKLKFIRRIENTYMFFNGEYKFCIEYEFSGKKAFVDYEAALMGNEYFVEALDISKTHVLYVFELPEELYPVVELFIEGKYSYLPEKDKIKGFLAENFQIAPSHKIFHILDRTSELRRLMEDKLGVEIPEELDLTDPPNIENEEFNNKEHHE
jgi:hypothetical protein